MKWWRAPAHIRDFNGLTGALVVDGTEYGVFRETHPVGGCRWSVRTRTGLACWGHPLPCRTASECRQLVLRLAHGSPAKPDRYDSPAGSEGVFGQSVAEVGLFGQVG